MPTHDKPIPAAAELPLLSPQQALDQLTVVPLIAGRPNAADILGCSPKTARRRAESGQIPTLKIGRRVMVTTAALRQILARSE